MRPVLTIAILHFVPHNQCWSDDWTKNNSALPGGLLKSKPTWPNAYGCSTTSAFFVLATTTFVIQARKVSMSLRMEVRRCCLPLLLMPIGMASKLFTNPVRNSTKRNGSSRPSA